MGGNCIEDSSCWLIAGCMKPGNCIFGGCCAANADGSADIVCIRLGSCPASDGLNVGVGDFRILSSAALAEDESRDF